jgi:hypothetical protein
MTRPVMSAIVVAVAILFFILGLYTGQPPVVGPRGPTVIAASIDVKCADGTKYSLSTGNKRGKCIAAAGQGNTVANCDDGKGNRADLNCANGCSSTAGSGSCTIK